MKLTISINININSRVITIKGWTPLEKGQVLVGVLIKFCPKLKLRLIHFMED